MSGIRGIIAADVTGDVPGKFWHEMFYHRLIGAVAGPSGAGKSLIVARLVADVTRTGGNVIWCPEEDPVMLRYRLDAAGADMSKVRIAQYYLPGDTAALEETIIHDGAVLAVFDTAQKHITMPMQRWAQPLEQLDGVCQRTECAAMFIHHTNKNVKKSADWQAAIGGATAGLIGSSRMVHLVGRRPDNTSQLVLCPVKDSYHEPPKAIAFDFDTEDFQQANGDTIEVGYLHLVEKEIPITNPVELVVVTGGGEGKGPAPERLAEAAEFLTELLANGAMPVTFYKVCPDHGAFGHDCDVCPKYAKWQLQAAKDKDKGLLPEPPPCTGDSTDGNGVRPQAEDAEISWGTLKRVRKPLGIVSSRRGAGKGSVPFMRLPDGHPKLVPGAPTDIDHIR